MDLKTACQSCLAAVAVAMLSAPSAQAIPITYDFFVTPPNGQAMLVTDTSGGRVLIDDTTGTSHVAVSSLNTGIPGFLYQDTEGAGPCTANTSTGVRGVFEKGTFQPCGAIDVDFLQTIELLSIDFLVRTRTGHSVVGLFWNGQFREFAMLAIGPTPLTQPELHTIDLSSLGLTGTLFMQATSQDSAFSLVSITVDDLRPAPVPEPATGWLALIGVGGLVAFGWLKRA